MKGVSVLVSVAALTQGVVGHATFQQLWVDGKDLISIHDRYIEGTS